MNKKIGSIIYISSGPYMQDLNGTIIVPADILASDSVRPSAGTMWLQNKTYFFQTSFGQ